MTPRKSQNTDGSAGENLPNDVLMGALKATADWVIVISKDGKLERVVHQNNQTAKGDYEEWVGKQWSDSVTIESQPKLKSLLQSAKHGVASRWRQVNHPLPDGSDLPVRYTSLRINDDDILVLGQDMLDLSEMQQRLIKAQHAIESDFAQLSQTQTRYQLIFDMSAEAVLCIDAHDQKIIQANPAAQRLLGKYIAPLENSKFPSGFDTDSTVALDKLLRRAQGSGRADDVAICTSDGKASFLASASLLRDRNESSFMVRLSPIGDAEMTTGEESLLESFSPLLANSPDGFVIADYDGNIVTANDAFIHMVQMPSHDSLIGKPLDTWLGRTSLDQRLLSNNVKDYGSVSKFSTVVVSDHGTKIEVELSAAGITDPRFPYMVMIVRNVESRTITQPSDELLIHKPGAPLKELVGRVPLKELVRESTDLIEKMCIEAALELTSDNRASAAEMLGVSRQSLYVKLRRFGLGEANISE